MRLGERFPETVEVLICSYNRLGRYLCNALDKGNVGNAKTDGWDKVRPYLTLNLASVNHTFYYVLFLKDIGLVGNQVCSTP